MVLNNKAIVTSVMHKTRNNRKHYLPLSQNHMSGYNDMSPAKSVLQRLRTSLLTEVYMFIIIAIN